MSAFCPAIDNGAVHWQASHPSRICESGRYMGDDVWWDLIDYLCHYEPAKCKAIPLPNNCSDRYYRTFQSELHYYWSISEQQ